jgi:DNA-binding beta-propeller fold protein YncE
MRDFSSRSLAAATLLTSLAATCVIAPASAENWHRQHRHERAPLHLSVVGTYSTGLGEASSEIAAYDPQSRRVFVTNAAGKSLDILDVRSPSTPMRIARIDLTALGTPNSVAIKHGLVAVAIEAAVKTDPGAVVFYEATGQLIAKISVPAQPDMVTFTPDGDYLLAANEGEPSGYGGAADVDPEGAVSIIRIPHGKHEWKKFGQANLRVAGFTKYDGQEASLRAQGIRIFGPAASAARDLEPEYITVSADSRTAYVTLQENDAIAIVDIARAQVTRLLPLGSKNYADGAQVSATYEWTDLPSIGRTAAGQRMTLGGFSGLAFEGTTRDGKLQFVTHTDRGPNGEPTGILRPFVLPGFTPRIVRFTLDPGCGRFELTEQILLKRADGSPLTGLPNTALSTNASQPYNDEVPVDLFGNVLPLDPLGADLEGIVVADDGTFWMPDEYRPALYHFDAKGKLLERFIPVGTHAAAGKPVPPAGAAGEFGIEALPAVIAQRRQNRGMEALAEYGGKLYAFVQSPIRNPVTLGNAALNALRNIRIVEFDPVTHATRQFLYALDNPLLIAGTPDTPADKIGDAVATPNGEFYTVERDDDAVPAVDVSVITKKIYKFALGNATDITGMDALPLDQMTATELAAAGVTPIAKALHVDLAKAGYAGVQKVEGLALLDDGRLAVLNDNDFGVARIVIDNATGTFTRAPDYVAETVTLGLIPVPGLDASDRDSRINIAGWPVRGLYLPDAIASFRSRGRTYLVTANEGDAREWPGLVEEARVSTLTLDPTAFPDAATLRQNANLGRHTVTRTLGDTDGDGDYDQLFTLGGRSFSIWSTDGTRVFDSGSDFERITAAEFPANFNASNSNATFDDRSDNKGPEPEAVAVGDIDGRTYAFIGLERIGGVMMYDVTDPTSPVFVDYLNNRDFAAGTGDLGPEGLSFISAHDSPNGRPMLLVANEISGTVTLYSIGAR